MSEWEAALALEDGSVFVGRPFGADAPASGEVVFNTAMTGYQEICTDASYRGQLVVLTHPQVGNYGVCSAAQEAERPWVAALLVRELAQRPHHWESEETLDAYLRRWGVPGLEGIDTRALTRRLRAQGAMRAVLRRSGPGGSDPAELARLSAEAQSVTPLSEKDLVAEVQRRESRVTNPQSRLSTHDSRLATRVVVVDYGYKANIVRSLLRRGAAVETLTWDARVEQIVAARPDGIVLSNGPGDPAQLDDAVRTVRRLMDRELPIMGICLGHQILGRAAGAATRRLPFGHHGGNHPVKELASGRVAITSQNHEFEVQDGPALAAEGFDVSHVSLNDGSVEGLRHRELPIFSVQFHPEGCPGPQDSQPQFDHLFELIRERSATVHVGARFPHPPGSARIGAEGGETPPLR